MAFRENSSDLPAIAVMFIFAQVSTREFDYNQATSSSAVSAAKLLDILTIERSDPVPIQKSVNESWTIHNASRNNPNTLDSSNSLSQLIILDKPVLHLQRWNL